MHACTYVCMHACMHVCIHVFACMYVRMYACMHACMHVFMYLHVCMYVCMHACMYIFMYVDTEVCTFFFSVLKHRLLTPQRCLLKSSFPFSFFLCSSTDCRQVGLFQKLLNSLAARSYSTLCKTTQNLPCK